MRNTYNEKVNQISAGACLQCPQYSKSLAASSSAARDCICEAGYYDALTTGLGPSCLECPSPGSSCLGNSTTLRTLPLERGYWRISNISVDLRQCPDHRSESSACLPGVGGCKNGTDGPMCTVCQRADFFYSAQTSQCMPCAERDLSLTLELVLICVGLLPPISACAFYARKQRRVRRFLDMLARLYYRLSPRAKLYVAARRTSHPDGQAVAAKRSFPSAVRRRKALFSLYQIASQIGEVYKIAIPSPVTAFFASIPFLSLDIANLFGPLSCFGLGGFFFELVAVLNLPLGLVLAIEMWYISRSLYRWASCRRCRRRSDPDEWLDETSEVEENVSRMGTFRGAIRGAMYSSLPAVLVVTYTCSPMAYNKGFAAFVCDEFPELLPPLAAEHEHEESAATTVYSYLVSDYNVVCGSNADYRQIERMGRAVLVLFVGIVPAAYITLLLIARKPITAADQFEATPLSSSLAFLYHDYKPTFFWWDFVDVSKKVTLIGFFRSLRPGSLVQLLAALSLSLTVFMAEAIAQPYRVMHDNTVAICCDFCLVLFLIFCLVLKVSSISNLLSGLNAEMAGVLQFNEAQLSLGMLLTLCFSLFFCGLVVSFALYEAAMSEATARRAAQKDAAAKGQMSKPPTCEWVLKPGHKYCSFLSHFKVEAGSDARYLSDLIKRMSGAASYLDSTDLTDLRTLFNEGVHKSDVLVILATKGVFTRPWCLMEMWEAAVCSIPILLFPVVGGGFELDDARALLGDLGNEMRARNPTCMAEVMAHVEKTAGVTDVREVEDVLLAHIGLVPTLERQGRPAALLGASSSNVSRPVELGQVTTTLHAGATQLSHMLAKVGGDISAGTAPVGAVSGSVNFCLSWSVSAPKRQRRARPIEHQAAKSPSPPLPGSCSSNDPSSRSARPSEPEATVRLQVRLVSATGLMAADSNGLSDPYARVRVAGTQQDSRVVPLTLDPVWDEDLHFEATVHELLSSSLSVEVRDRDRFGKHDSLGVAHVDLGPVLAAELARSQALGQVTQGRREFVQRLCSMAGAQAGPLAGVRRLEPSISPPSPDVSPPPPSPPSSPQICVVGASTDADASLGVQRGQRPEDGGVLDEKLAKHLQREVADLGVWLVEHNKAVEQRLEWLSWQSWGTDNQIIASVEALLNECANVMGREKPRWTDPRADAKKKGRRSRAGGWFRMPSVFALGPEQPADDALLLICSADECGGTVRMLQREVEKKLDCPVSIGSTDINVWREQVEGASRGVVLLQTKSVLRNPVRLLQLHRAIDAGYPLVCVVLKDGGYDFADVSPLLRNLQSELPDFATLHAALAANGQARHASSSVQGGSVQGSTVLACKAAACQRLDHPHGAPHRSPCRPPTWQTVGCLTRRLIKAVPNTISVAFNPNATERMQDASIDDILDKLHKSTQLQTTIKAMPTSPWTSGNSVRRSRRQNVNKGVSRRSRPETSPNPLRRSKTRMVQSRVGESQQKAAAAAPSSLVRGRQLSEAMTRVEAATRIQAHVRGWLTRRRSGRRSFTVAQPKPFTFAPPGQVRLAAVLRDEESEPREIEKLSSRLSGRSAEGVPITAGRMLRARAKAAAPAPSLAQAGTSSQAIQVAHSWLNKNERIININKNTNDLVLDARQGDSSSELV